MIIFKIASHLTAYLQEQKAKNKTVGFVPTMGALHNGHLSLLQSSLQQTDITVCSIFVNPTQFTNADDFKFYPVTIEKDIEQLLKAACPVLLLPSVNEIYPPGYHAKHYELGLIETILEGFYRPDHFQGVCQVMERMLDIVNPDQLFMGQKDYQQCLVVKKLIQLLHLQNKVQFKMQPTRREEDGLAMSSRNLRLAPEEREKAPAIYQQLQNIKDNLRNTSLESLIKEAAHNLEEKGFKVDYVAIADAETLMPVQNTSQKMVALIAASLEKIRLIDNLPLN